MLARALERAFGIRPRERRLVLVFFLHFAAVGTFVTVAVTAGDTLFLSRFRAAEAERLLPFVYVCVGGAAVLATLALERVRARVRRATLLAATPALLAVSVVLLGQAVRGGSRPALFGLVVWLEVCSLLATTLVFSYAGDFFTGRDARRLYGFMAGGLAAGTVLSGAAVSVVVERLGAESLLVGSAGFLAADALLVVWISRLGTPVAAGEPSGEEGDATPLSALVSDRYVLLIFGIVLCGLLCTVVSDYQLKIAAGRSMDEAALAAFFGRFYAALGAVQLVVQLAVVPLVLRRLGVMRGLLLVPALMLLVSGGFFLFPTVLVAALAEFLRQSFSDTLDLPSRELLFLPLPARLRQGAQALSGGALEAVGQALAGGIVLLVMSRTAEIRWLALAGVVGAGLWSVAVLRLKGRYEETLALSLRREAPEPDALERLLAGPEGERVLSRLLDGSEREALLALELLEGRVPRALLPRLLSLSSSTRPGLAKGAIALLPELGGAPVEEALRRALETPRDAAAATEEPTPRPPGGAGGGAPPPNAAVRGQALVSLGRLLGDRALPELDAALGDPELEVRRAALVALGKHAGVAGAALFDPRLSELLASPADRDRVEAARVLRLVGSRRFVSALVRLLSDPSEAVREEAALALLSLPPEAAVPLSARARDRALSTEARAAVVRALAALGGAVAGPREAARALVELLDPAEELSLRAEASRALEKLGGRAPLEPRVAGRVRARLEGHLEAADLALAARRPCAGTRAADLFRDHAQVELELALTLLSPELPRGRARQIRAGLESGSAPLVSNALELLEVSAPRGPGKRMGPLLGALHDEVPASGAGLDDETRARLRAASPWLAAITRHHAAASGSAGPDGRHSLNAAAIPLAAATTAAAEAS